MTVRTAATPGAPLALRDAAGAELDPVTVSWDVQDPILVALAAGYGPARHLDTVYEAEGPHVVPTFASLITGQWLVPLLNRLGADRRRALFGATSLELRHELPPSGSLRVGGRVAGVDATGGRARIVVEVVADDADGRVAIGRTSVVLLGAGGPEPWTAGDARLPSRDAHPAREPDAVLRTAVGDTASALYRTVFPLRAGEAYADAIHIDPSAAASAGLPGPVVHGVTLLGLLVRRAQERRADDAPVAGYAGRFRAPVIPGEELDALLWDDDTGVTAALRRPGGEVVLADAHIGFATREGAGWSR